MGILCISTMNQLRPYHRIICTTRYLPPPPQSIYERMDLELRHKAAKVPNIVTCPLCDYFLSIYLRSYRRLIRCCFSKVDVASPGGLNSMHAFGIMSSGAEYASRRRVIPLCPPSARH